jgi:hypothetical protein
MDCNCSDSLRQWLETLENTLKKYQSYHEEDFVQANTRMQSIEIDTASSTKLAKRALENTVRMWDTLYTLSVLRLT